MSMALKPTSLSNGHPPSVMLSCVLSSMSLALDMSSGMSQLDLKVEEVGVSIRFNDPKKATSGYRSPYKQRERTK